MIEVAAKELQLVSKVVIQTEGHEIIFESFSNGGAESFGVRPVTDVGVVAKRHHVPKLLDSRTDADAAGIAGKVACRAAQR